MWETIRNACGTVSRNRERVDSNRKIPFFTYMAEAMRNVEWFNKIRLGATSSSHPPYAEVSSIPKKAV